MVEVEFSYSADCGRQADPNLWEWGRVETFLVGIFVLELTIKTLQAFLVSRVFQCPIKATAYTFGNNEVVPLVTDTFL